MISYLYFFGLFYHSHGPADSPAVIAEQKIIYTADRAVRCLDGGSMDVGGSPQHDVFLGAVAPLSNSGGGNPFLSPSAALRLKCGTFKGAIAEGGSIRLHATQSALGAHFVPDVIEARWDHPVAYLNSGSILSPSLVPPGSITFLSPNFRVS